MVEVFGAPPFSVLDAKQGYWRDRKKQWIDLGIKSELSREDVSTYDMRGYDENVSAQNMSLVSIFDPVLCEIMYKWFNVDGGKILDPFAGGSVRGIVAEKLGYKYIGIDLRQEQVDANILNAKDIGVSPRWICGDSTEMDNYFSDDVFDMVFTCPPYANLEVYSDNDKDLSNMEYCDFIKAYGNIIAKSYRKLKQDRFFVIVVGEVRNKEGDYYNFVGDTIKSCIDAGYKYYNELILCTPCGTLPFRAGHYMNTYRKIGKQHQNVLVFYKGDIKNIKINYKEIVKKEDIEKIVDEV